jgi:predicted nucleotidyltransferase
MDREQVLSIVSRFKKALEERGVRPERVILFGSHADGTAHEGSDIDLVVISEDFADRGYWDRIEVLAEAVAELWEPIEAIAMTPEEWEKGDSPLVEYARDGVSL